MMVLFMEQVGKTFLKVKSMSESILFIRSKGPNNPMIWFQSNIGFLVVLRIQQVSISMIMEVMLTLQEILHKAASILANKK